MCVCLHDCLARFVLGLWTFCTAYIYIYHFDEFAHLTGMALNRLHIYFDQNDSHDIKPNLLAHERPRIGVVANVYLIQFV